MSSPRTLSPTDCYKILELSPDASDETIRKKYIELAKKWHPDKNKDDKAIDKFKEINEAYHVLIVHPKTKEEVEISYEYFDYQAALKDKSEDIVAWDELKAECKKKGFQNVLPDLIKFFNRFYFNGNQQVKNSGRFTVNYICLDFMFGNDHFLCEELFKYMLQHSGETKLTKRHAGEADQNNPLMIALCDLELWTCNQLLECAFSYYHIFYRSISKQSSSSSSSSDSTGSYLDRALIVANENTAQRTSKESNNPQLLSLQRSINNLLNSRLFNSQFPETKNLLVRKYVDICFLHIDNKYQLIDLIIQDNVIHNTIPAYLVGSVNDEHLNRLFRTGEYFGEYNIEKDIDSILNFISRQLPPETDARTVRLAYFSLCKAYRPTLQDLQKNLNFIGKLFNNTSITNALLAIDQIENHIFDVILPPLSSTYGALKKIDVELQKFGKLTHEAQKVIGRE